MRSARKTFSVGDAIGVIPARYASTRFPGKPLVDILGMSMVQRVQHQASQSERLSRVVVATDDERIYDHVKQYGGDVVMTSPHHASGTDRCAEVLAQLDGNFDVVVNIQGDEPFIHPKQIDLVVGLFDRPEVGIGTLVKQIGNEADLHSDTVIKVVRDQSGRALYFSRNAIPHVRGALPSELLGRATFFKHIGIYAFRPEVLRTLATLPLSALESAEGLEQLRWLENGYDIHLAETGHESNSVDTPADLERMLREMR
ncbi:MAG: 3-deoxy-manno-octulosonate cytidylyltransferase [Flavobacteriales bacterium]|nr:3-deoxy-manno-octulosonate cytidylyltransferase [Flavobacteriales bacterium]